MGKGEVNVKGTSKYFKGSDSKFSMDQTGKGSGIGDLAGSDNGMIAQPRQFVPPLDPGDLTGNIVLISRDNWEQKKGQLQNDEVSCI